MGDGKSKTLHKITRWGSAANSSSSTRTGGAAHAAANQPLTLVEPLDPEDLKQGQLYIVKISLVKLALFEGMFWLVVVGSISSIARGYDHVKFLWLLVFI